MHNFTLHTNYSAEVHIAGGRPERSQLSLVPAPHRCRAAYAPLGRTMVLLDIENLMRGPTADSDALTDALNAVNDALLVRDGDHVIVAANHRLAAEVKIARPTLRVVAGGGPDGADRALLAELSDVEWVTQRFDRVVIGSGDGIFAQIVRALRSAGIPVGIVSRADALSRSLEAAASFVRLLPAEDHRVAA